MTEVAALFASPAAICEELLLYSGTHVLGSSLSDQSLACDTAVLRGASLAAVIAAVVASGKGAENVLWYLLREGTLGQPGVEVPAPTESDPDPIPNKFPEAWPIRLLAESLIDLNPEAGLEEGPAEDIAKRCEWEMAKAGYDGFKECATLPVFVSGYDVKTATLHDLEALAEVPKRIVLNYEPRKAKKERGEKRGWYKGMGGCAPPKPEGEYSCDEYPFFATQQGGPEKTPEPSLKWIIAKDNKNQGGFYGNFISACKMGTRIKSNHAFVSLPIPPSLKIHTTYGLCNGESS